MSRVERALRKVPGAAEASVNLAVRKAVMGALALYLDFVNMLLMLLRLVGDRR